MKQKIKLQLMNLKISGKLTNELGDQFYQIKSVNEQMKEERKVEEKINNF